MPPTSSAQQKTTLNKLLDSSLILAIFVAPISVILNNIFGGGYIYWAALPDFLISICFVFALILKLKAGGLKALFQSKLDVLVWAYLALSLIYLLVGILAQNSFLSLGQGFLSAARFAIVYLSFRLANFKLSDFAQKKAAKTILIVILVFGLIQFIYPDALSLMGYGSSPIKPNPTVDGTDLVRMQSFLRGPNPYGAFLLIPFSLILFKFKDFKNKRLAASLLTLISLNLILTWSRSAWLGAVLILGFFILTKLKLNKKMIISTLIVGLVLALTLSLVARTDSFKTVFLHDKPGEGGAVTSDQDRVKSYKNALILVAEHPLGLGLNGAGPASVRSDSGANIVENYFLQIFLQLGWAGGILLITISALSLIKLVGLKSDLSLGLAASGLALSLIGLMQPVWADVSVVFLWWSLLAICSAKNKNVVI